VAAGDRAGVQRGQPWTGDSHQRSGGLGAGGGRPGVGTAGPGVGTAIAYVDLAATHDKSLTEYVNLIGDRRLDLY
jgi:hypothetical protein